METKIPATGTVLSALLRTDFTTQWRNRRSVILVLLVPVIILISWKPAVNKLGGTFVLSSCITIGLTAIGLMGYANAIARDRDKGVFQRLRIAPIPTWTIMTSRLAVQLFMILLVTSFVFIIGADHDGIHLSPAGYAVSYFTALVGGALYLGLGQMIVGLVKNAETVNSTSRLVYFVFIMVGMFGDLGILGQQVKEIVQWSPYGTVKTILAYGMNPSTWNNHATVALIVSIFYAFVFSFLGIKWFRWNVK
jgi:ABC-2 type transport system permease protein